MSSIASFRMGGLDINEDKQKSEVVDAYSYEDFIETTKPYEEVYKYVGSPFEHQKQIERMTKIARSVGFPTFKGVYKQYIKSVNQAAHSTQISQNPTDFSNAPLQLEAGRWQCDDNGVYSGEGWDEKCACHHPILPIECWENIDTGEEKLKLAYRKRAMWRSIVVSKEILYSSNKITALASRGIDVTSESSKYLVNFLQDIEQLNLNVIPVKKSVSRLGMIADNGFSPYVKDVMFDGESEYEKIYKAVSKPKGTYEGWIKTAGECRRMSLTARIILAASFGSILVKIVGSLPFFVHLWGGSGTGKSVALMLSASVWADPEFGTYIQTFDSTNVGHERTCAFLNNLPYCIDELQLARDSRGNTSFNVYKLAQGVGRTRGKKTGGIEQAPTWSNCILTTGESPLTNISSGAGAVNRVIDIECSEKDKVIDQGQRIARELRQNYGHAGRMFVELIMEDKELQEDIRRTQQSIFNELSKKDTTEKQAAAASIILTADNLITEMFFKDGLKIKTDEICEFLQSRSSVSAGLRAYQYMCDWVSINSNKFINNESASDKSEYSTNEVYGIIQNSYAYIIKSKFVSVLEAEGFSYNLTRSYLKENNLILTRGRNCTRGKRINGINTECIAMKLPDYDSENQGDKVINNGELL